MKIESVIKDIPNNTNGKVAKKVVHEKVNVPIFMLLLLVMSKELKLIRVFISVQDVKIFGITKHAWWNTWLRTQELYSV